MTDVKPILVGITEAAKMLGLGRSSIYRMINDGTLDPVRLGGRVMIRIADIERLVERATEEQA